MEKQNKDKEKKKNIFYAKFYSLIIGAIIVVYIWFLWFVINFFKTEILIPDKEWTIKVGCYFLLASLTLIYIACSIIPNLLSGVVDEGLKYWKRL